MLLAMLCGVWDLSSLTRDQTLLYINKYIYVLTYLMCIYIHRLTYLIFHWNVVDLQCCVSFCSIAKQVGHRYPYICSFLDFIFTQVITEYSGSY